MQSKVILRPCFFAVLSLGLTLSAGATESESQAQETVTAETIRHSEQNQELMARMAEARALAESMSRVFIDPATGAIRQPTNAELRQIAAVARASQQLTRRAAPVTFTLPGGGLAAEVPAELVNYSFVQLDEDGEVSLRCSDGEPDVFHTGHDHATEDR